MTQALQLRQMFTKIVYRICLAEFELADGPSPILPQCFAIDADIVLMQESIDGIGIFQSRAVRKASLKLGHVPDSRT